MKRQLTISLAAVILLAFFFAFTVSNEAFAQSSRSTDTIPKKPKNFDDILLELDKSLEELEAQKGKLLVPSIDVAKLQAEIERSMKDINPEKIQAEVNAALKSMDSAKIHMELSRSMASIDMDKMKAELEKMKEVDMAKMQQELEKVKNIDLSKMEEQLKAMGPQIERSMQEAKEGVQKAKAEMTAFRDFTNALHEAGLIDKNGKYTIQHKDGELIINGKTQSKEVYQKHESFLKSRKNFTIKNENGLNIFMD